ncbi:MAG: winged helix-turn-helix transcriptional regulator [Candidatus Woesearchaeota archaeon]|nr:winged helix-turn-helix transcriptional regulator [Candidatus Woesearchaeota archaeon]
MRVLVLFLLLLPGVLGASISGSVYDLSLDTVNTAVVTIDTTPEQRVVAKDGTYSFEVPAGSYTLVANAVVDDEAWVVREELTVSSEGAYTLDLILEPDFEIDLSLGEAPVVDIPEESDAKYIVLLVIALLAIVAVVVYYMRKLPSQGDDEELLVDEYKEQVLRVLKQHKGRITQRELRKSLPFSEAKVSLVVTELEADGIVKKIKKGRGNVIVKV